MSVERRRRLESELRAAIALLGTIDVVAAAIATDDRDVDALRAVRLLLQRQLDRVDGLLLALSADRLDDEHGGPPADSA